ncbi:RNA-dependent RNA polymerase [Trichoderma harzianum ambiguivirus 1]|nr:RNA-dependent RNA polymerase [Trichoderma harzianum ambiguivirus 1]
MVAWPCPAPGTYVPHVHRVCPHNEVGAICRRVLADLPPEVFGPVSEGYARAFRKIKKVARLYNGVKWELMETALSYEGPLRRRYVEAALSLEDHPLDLVRDSRLSCFLKAEKINLVKKWSKPRMIYPRDPRYNISLARYLKPFEHFLWSKLTAERLGLRGGKGRLVAKGLNPSQRGQLIAKKFNNITDCVVMEIDGSAFEAHVGPATLEQEHGVYLAAYRGDKRLRALLNCQKRLFGRLSCGARFSRDGGRASGDFNTGMGNSLVTLGVGLDLAENFECLDMLIDGDNALLFFAKKDMARLVAMVYDHGLQCCGQEMTLENPVEEIEKIRFGQSAPVLFPGGYKMVRDPFKVMSGATASHRWLREPSFRREYLTGVALCELSVNVGVPLLQEFSLELLRAMDFKGRVRAHPFRDYFYLGASLERAEPVSIPLATRESFERAFGVGVEEQLSWESSFKCPSPDQFLEMDPCAEHEDQIPGLDECYADYWRERMP